MYWSMTEAGPQEKLSYGASHFRRPHKAQCTALVACPVAGGEGMPGGFTKGEEGETELESFEFRNWMFTFGPTADGE